MPAYVIVLIIISILLVFTLIAYIVSNHMLTVNNYRVDNAPQSFNGFKICQLSDIHAKRYGRNQKRFIEKIRAASPDIIVLTGDYEYTDKINNTSELANGIKRIAPVYYITGNHEYRSGQIENIRKVFDELGFINLDETFTVITRGNDSITFAGLSDLLKYADMSVKNDKYHGAKNEYLKQLYKIDAVTKNYKVLLTHRPDFFEEYADTMFDLVLTGHAHGGFVRFPFINGLIAPQQGFFPKYTSGFYKRNGTSMFVSRGCGGKPLRLFNRPEIAVITLIAD